MPAPSSVAGLTGGGAGAAPDAIGGLLQQLNTAIQALQQAVAGGAILGGGAPAMPCQMDMGASPVPTDSPGQAPTQTPEQAPAEGPKDSAKPADEPPARKRPKHDDPGQGPRGGGGGRGPRETPPAAGSPPPAAPPVTPPAPSGDGGASGAPETETPPRRPGPSPEQRERLIDRRSDLQAELARLTELLGKHGGGAGTTAAVERIRAIHQELREIAAALNGRAA